MAHLLLMQEVYSSLLREEFEQLADDVTHAGNTDNPVCGYVLGLGVE